MMVSNRKFTSLFFGVLALATASCGKNDQQAAQVAGLTVASNLLVSSSTSDYCTQFAGEVCTFDGGQRVMFSDGTVLLTGMFSFTRNSGGSSDSDQNSVTVMVPPTVSTSYQTLSQFVARGSGDQKLFLSYTRSPEAVQLFYDTNGDGVLDAGDELLYTASLYSW